MTEEQATIRSLRAEIARLHRQMAEREHLAPSTTSPPLLDITAPAHWHSWELLQRVIDTIPDPICVKDTQHCWIACNQSFCTLFGYPREMIIGYSDPDLLPPEEARVFWEKDDEVFVTRQPNFNEEVATNADGTITTIWTRKFPLFDAHNRLAGLCAIATDVSELRRRHEELNRRETEIQLQRESEQLALKQQIIDAQQAALRDLSTPLLPLSDQVIMMPLVGALDAQRAQQVLETLLVGVAQRQATLALIDITGMEAVDTQVAQALIQAAQAVKLLGARVMITGIQPQIAQTLVTLGVDLSGIMTHGTLQAGIADALFGRIQR